MGCGVDDAQSYEKNIKYVMSCSFLLNEMFRNVVSSSICLHGVGHGIGSRCCAGSCLCSIVNSLIFNAV